MIIWWLKNMRPQWLQWFQITNPTCFCLSSSICMPATRASCNTATVDSDTLIHHQLDDGLILNKSLYSWYTKTHLMMIVWIKKNNDPTSWYKLLFFMLSRKKNWNQIGKQDYRIPTWRPSPLSSDSLSSAISREACAKASRMAWTKRGRWERGRFQRWEKHRAIIYGKNVWIFEKTVSAKQLVKSFSDARNLLWTNLYQYCRYLIGYLLIIGTYQTLFWGLNTSGFVFDANQWPPI